MFLPNPWKVISSLSPKQRIPPWGWIRVAIIVVGGVILMEFAGIHGSGNLRAPTATDVGFIQ
jgi:hypothetical protein